MHRTPNIETSSYTLFSSPPEKKNGKGSTSIGPTSTSLTSLVLRSLKIRDQYLKDIYTEENLCETPARFLTLKLRWQMLWRWAKHIVQFLSIFALGGCLTSYFDRLQVTVSYQLVKSIYTFSSYGIKWNAHTQYTCILSVKWQFNILYYEFSLARKDITKDIAVWQYLALWPKKRKHILSSIDQLIL